MSIYCGGWSPQLRHHARPRRSPCSLPRRAHCLSAGAPASAKPDASEGLRTQYRLDHARRRPNGFAPRMSGTTVGVVLELGVATVCFSRSNARISVGYGRCHTWRSTLGKVAAARREPCRRALTEATSLQRRVRFFRQSDPTVRRLKCRRSATVRLPDDRSSRTRLRRAPRPGGR